MMTFRYVIERSERVAGAAAFIASLPAETTVARPRRPTPMLLCNGTEDALIRWDGGEITGGRGRTVAIADCVAFWREVNGCTDEPEVETLPDLDPEDGCTIERRRFAPDPDGAALEFLVVHGGGHGMPSPTTELPDTRLVRRYLGTICRDAEGAELAWRFLSRHRSPNEASSDRDR
jgi:polyhydroxybutyrate depolymerase